MSTRIDQMTTFSPCDACGTFMLRYGTCPKCGARKATMLTPQAMRVALLALGMAAVALSVPVFLLFAAAIAFRVVSWLAL